MGMQATSTNLTYARNDYIKVGHSFIFDRVGDMIYYMLANDDISTISTAVLKIGTFGTPLTVTQTANYPLGIFGEISAAQTSGGTVQRAVWARLKVSEDITAPTSIYGGQLQYRWADGADQFGSGTENCQLGGAWLYFEQDTTGQTLQDYAHASGAVVQVETFGAFTIDTNAHLSGVQIESRLGAANSAAISLNSGTIAGLFITKSPAASGVTAQDWPYGIFIEDCTVGIQSGAPIISTSDRGFATTATFVPDASRLDYAYSMGNRAGELTVNLAAAASQHLELFQANVNVTCTAEPLSASTVCLMRLRYTHDSTDMTYLRLRAINSYTLIEREIQDAYGCIHGIDFYTNSVTVNGEAAVGVFNMECNSDVTGTVRGVIVNVYGNGVPSTTSVGLEVRIDGSSAGTLTEGIRVRTVGGNAITTGLNIYGGGVAKAMYAATTPTAATSAAVNLVVTDSASQTSGRGRGLYIQYTVSGSKTSSYGIRSVAVDTTISASCPSVYGASYWMSGLTTETVGFYCPMSLYAGKSGSNVSSYVGLDIGMSADNAPSTRNAFIRCRAHQAVQSGGTVLLLEGNGTATYLLTYDAVGAQLAESTDSSTCTHAIAVRLNAISATKYIHLFDA